MSIFTYRKPSTEEPPRDRLTVLRETLNRLNVEPKTPQMEDLERILRARIAEMERKTA